MSTELQRVVVAGRGEDLRSGLGLGVGYAMGFRDRITRYFG